MHRFLIETRDNLTLRLMLPPDQRKQHRTAADRALLVLGWVSVLVCCYLFGMAVGL